VVETDAGLFMVKLRGAAHGTAALVAEIVVAELAEALGLRVPSRAFVTLEPGVPSDDPDQELREDLLDASHGLNLGFPYLQGAREIGKGEVDAAPDELALPVLWLDALVLNPDRTPENPNILVWQREPWLIDHGACLPFQYRWSAVTEDAPRRDDYPLERHLFGGRAERLGAWDERLASRLTRDILEAALVRVPDDFLRPLLPHGADGDKVARRRQAYVAFLWKRLKTPRPFVTLTSRTPGRSFDLA
jgi:HipA-like protein